MGQNVAKTGQQQQQQQQQRLLTKNSYVVLHLTFWHIIDPIIISKSSIEIYPKCYLFKIILPSLKNTYRFVQNNLYIDGGVFFNNSLAFK